LDVSATTKENLLRIDFSRLPFNLAVKNVKGDGSRTLVVFADPNCAFCRKLERDLAPVTNVTIYTFLYPILGPNSIEKSRNVWCANEPVSAWKDMVIDARAPAVINPNCTAPVNELLALGKDLGINGTPTIFLPSGKRVSGHVPTIKIEELLQLARSNR
jgi:thiol:disulfide interchange protein DsbC